MADHSSSSSGGIGILGVLGVVFVTLKLTGYIDWSWWWVTAPFWGGFALVIAILVTVVLCVSAGELRSKPKEKRRPY